MKITWVTFGLGWLAIIGVPRSPGSGARTRSSRRRSSARAGGPGCSAWPRCIGAGITAFYMTRLFFMTFHGERRWTDDVHPHESPLVMTIPLMVLAVGSAFLGLLLGPTGHHLELAGAGRRRRSRRGALRSSPVAGHHRRDPAPGRRRRGARLDAVRARARSRRGPGRRSLLTRAARQDLYQDAVNEALLMRPGSTSPGRWSSSTTAASTAPSTGWPPDRRHVRAVAPAADRVRPLVRPVDVRGRRRPGRRHAAGEALT